MEGRDCPRDAELLAWLQDQPSEWEPSFTSHLDTCRACEIRLDRLAQAEELRAAAAAGDNFLEDLRRPPPSDCLEAEPECASAGVLAASAQLGSSSFVRSGRPDTNNIEPPTHVGQYEILGVLGRGGMGVAYKARQPKANRVVALKMILASKYASIEEQVRFRIETEAVASLQHPNIVQLLEVGEHDSMPFFSLEYCDGGSLNSRLKTWTPSLLEAAALSETLARAIHHAHLRGVVHRDLKPSNVLLTCDGTPKISDFGLAKKLDSDSDLSRTGTVMGTPSYMAPEQAEGKVHDVGPATDVYALGAILYELLAGRPPFRGETAFDTISQLKTDEPPSLSRIRPGVPRDLETICLKCLRKQPGKRYASSEALADDLLRFQRGEPVVARPVGSLERAAKWARRRPAPAALLLVAFLGVAGITWKYVDAENQRTTAEAKEKVALHEAARAKKARDFLVGIFELSDPNNPRGAMDARRILDDAALRIPREFADQPELQRELLEAIESVYARMSANAPLAMILEARGSVTLHSARDSSRADPQTLLYDGDRLHLAADAQVQLVFLSDLHKERLDPGKEATVRRKGCEPADAVRERNQDFMMTFVRLPKGTFYMGGGGGKAGAKSNINEDFEIAVHLVTQGQWQQVMGNNPSSFSRFGPDFERVKNISDEELKLFPVECVNGLDAQQFVAKLNEKSRGSGWTYRLPTEAEWEYACRAGATTPEGCSYHFYFSKPTNAISSSDANFDGRNPYGGAAKGQCLQRPTRVGAYPPNQLGLCDMHGNLTQWCVSTGGSGLVLRSGGWGSVGFYCGASARTTPDPWLRTGGFGFRLVRVAER